MNPDPSVAVVIPVKDSASTLPDTVAAVLRQPSVREVVLAVAPSSDETETVARTLAATWPLVHVIANPIGTTPAGLNLAVAATTADVIVRVDAHARLPDGYVARAVAVMMEHGAANVGGRQVPVSPPGFGAAVGAAMRSPVGSGGASYRHTEGGVREADTVYLGVFDRAALDQVGGYDETMLRNQDAELNLRLRRAGHKVMFCPDLAVDYRPRNSIRELATQFWQYGRYRRRTVGLHPGSLQSRQAAPAALVSVLAIAAGHAMVTGRGRPAAMTIGGYAAVLVVAGVVADRRRPLQVAAALATMHLSWGAGFLVGAPRR